MTENTDNPLAHRQSLHVLPNSGKVEELRRQMQEQLPAAASDEAEASVSEGTGPESPIEKKLLEGKVIEVLRSVYDPEIPVNIYELGLIYEVNILPDNAVHVRMTLTAPACPVAGTLPGEVEAKIQAIPEVKSANVELVWEPPWSRERMSEAALLQLGFL